MKKEYKNIESCRRHSKSHNKVIYNCDICFKNYSRNDTLVKHKKKIHGDYLEEKKMFKNVFINDEFVAETENVEVYSCHICEQTFFREEIFRAHMKLHQNKKIKKKNIKIHPKEKKMSKGESYDYTGICQLNNNLLSS